MFFICRIAKRTNRYRHKHPSATLDARSVPSNTSLADGIMPPSLTGDQLQAKTYGDGMWNWNVYYCWYDNLLAVI